MHSAVTRNLANAGFIRPQVLIWPHIAIERIDLVAGAPSATRGRARLPLGIATALLFAALPGIQPEAAAQEAGRIGMPDSWKSAEFKRDWGLEAVNAHHAYARGLTGRGISIGHWDDGAALHHPEFAGRGHIPLTLAEKGCAYSPNISVLRGPGGCRYSKADQLGETREIEETDGRRVNTDKYEDHGTHTAGTIAAARDGKNMHGIAFDSRLVVGQYHSAITINEWMPKEGFSEITTRASSGAIDDPESIASFYNQLRSHGVRVANIEMWSVVPKTPASENTLAGIEKTYRQIKAQADALADGAKRNGILNVVTLGNDEGRQANLYSGVPHVRPDAEPFWLSVANVKRDGKGGYEIEPGSSICAYTRRYCISAPGTDIYSTSVSGGSGGQLIGALDGEEPLQWQRGNKAPQYTYATYTGTSMAAPSASGAIALLLQRYPYLTVTQVRDVMLTTAKDLGKPGPDEIYGWGLMDLRKAIDGPGQLLVDNEIRMNQRAGGAKVWRGAAWDDWRNDIGGKGVLTKSGKGILRLSGRNRFGGLRVREGAVQLTGDNAYPASVEGGLLQVNGTLATAMLPVAPAGRLGGVGRIVGDVRMDGTLAPGNSIGTLTVQGNYVQGAGSSYLAEVSADGRSDRLDVSGQARLNGGRLVVSAAPGDYWLGQSFELLRAGRGVVGRFGALQQPKVSPFLAFGLNYGARGMGLQVTRGERLAAYARTPNQRAAATAADRLAINQGLPRALTRLSPGPAMAALDRLSGASHASQRSLLLEDGRRLRESAFDRLRTGRSTFAGDPKGAAVDGVWAQAQMISLSLPDDGNASAARYQGSGGLIGYDHRFESGLRLGVLGGGSRSDGQFGRFERSRVRSKQVGVYAGHQWGGVELASSFSWAGHGIRMDRRIAIDGFSDRDRSDYDARSRQLAFEASYRFAFAGGELAPYAEWSRQWVNTDAFQEQGGIAALRGGSSHGRVDFSTAGVRWGMDLRSRGQSDAWLRLHGSAGRRFASGDRLPEATLNWRGGDVFTVSGVPVAKQSTVVSFGIAARVSRNGLLDLGYDGQFAGKVRDNGLRARYSLRF